MATSTVRLLSSEFAVGICHDAQGPAGIDSVKSMHQVDMNLALGYQRFYIVIGVCTECP